MNGGSYLINLKVNNEKKVIIKIIIYLKVSNEKKKRKKIVTFLSRFMPGRNQNISILSIIFLFAILNGKILNVFSISC